MPAYEYACKDCGKDFTVFLSLQELESGPRLRCPHCQSDHVERRFGTFYAKTAKKS